MARPYGPGLPPPTGGQERPMNTGISAIALTLSLLGLSACSSADGDQPSADHTTASSSSSASDAAASAPAIRMRDSGGQWTSCVPYTRSEGDFVWTGAR